jgi:O-succinylbenzoic acid--CoA ligase
MSGYAALGAAPPAVPGQRRFLSRDLGYLDARGVLHLTGRADDMLVTGGENVHPERIESILSACPGVRDVAISALDDPVWGKRLMAVATGPVSLKALEDWSRIRLARAQRPRGFVKIRQLPRNDLGKLDRKRIEQYLPGWIDKQNTP